MRELDKYGAKTNMVDKLVQTDMVDKMELVEMVHLR
jgi:hypothetical protein